MGVFKRWIKSKDGSKTAYWYIRYTVNGKERWESVGKAGVITKDVANARLEERRRQVRLGQLNMIGVFIPTLGEFAGDYLDYIINVKQNRSWRRTREALNHFKAILGEKKLSEITGEDIDIYKSRRLNEGAKPSTVNRELAVIKHVFNTAKNWGKFFGENPVSRSGLLEADTLVERILTPEEEPLLSVVLIIFVILSP